MRKVVFTALLIGLITLISCKKDKNSDQAKYEAPKPTQNYLPLEIGNYWVYENYMIKYGQEILSESTDSIVIIGDTIIRGETYFVLGGHFNLIFEGRLPIRDSLGYLINSNGNIYFTLNNIGDIYENHISMNNDVDTIYTKQSYTDSVEEQIEVPAGFFPARKKVTNYEAYFFGNTNDSLRYRTIYSYFTEGVGQITNQSITASNLTVWEKRLVKYHIQEQP